MAKPQPRVTGVDGNPGTTGGSGESDNGGGNHGPVVIDPADISAAADAGNGNSSGGDDNGNGAAGASKRRRGRPRGTGTRKTEKENVLLGDVLSSVLFSGHLVIAGLAKSPELVLNEDEAKSLGTALASVSAYYVDVKVSAQAAAWVNLAMVVGAVYGPRVVMLRARRESERPQRAKDVSPKPEPAQEPYSGIPDDYMPFTPGMGPIN